MENNKIQEQPILILEADDEEEIISILTDEEFTSNDDFKDQFNL